MTYPLDEIHSKVFNGERLTAEDGLALEASNELFTLGEMANFVRGKKNGNLKTMFLAMVV